MRRALLASPLLLVTCAPAPPREQGPLTAKAATVGKGTDAATPTPTEPTYGATSTTQIGALDDHAWPPPKMAVEGDKPAPKEGEWAPWQRDWLHTIEGAPPTFYTGFVRPDPARAAKVEVVAMDARQLELDMAIGVEGPFPPDEKTAGKWPRAGGKLPREAGVAKRVVAAWNGGFRFDQGKWGMSIRRREFQPPVPDVASLLMFDDGRLAFGTWGPKMSTPPDVRSLRQNLDPLVDGDEIDPRKRPKWGGILATGKQVGQRAKRAGLCRTKGGHVLYLWGNELDPHDLGSGMKKAGCDYGLHLDMNLYHVGFVFMSWDDAKYEKGKSEALSMAMGVAHTRYVHAPSPKEFFYATLREPLPPGFAADGQPQPAPAWTPSITMQTTGTVRVTRFDARRLRATIVGGHAELDPSGRRLFETSPPPPISGDDAARVLAALRLGVATKEAPLGLVLDGAARTKPSPGAATLFVDARGRLGIAAPGAPVPPSRYSLEAPLLVLAGKAVTLPATLDLALGLDAKGNLLVAEKTSTPDASALVQALLQAGCVVAIAPRGGGARLERAGRDPIATGGADSRIYLLAARPEPTTFRFDLDEQDKPLWPKVTTPVK
ncbi:MAG: hypothetical protein JNL79_32055 [Myxococcales bacterium]|nr:hypothetical protein [Myxococcales bacterium]